MKRRLILAVLCLGLVSACVSRQPVSDRVRQAFVAEIGAIGTLALKNPVLTPAQVMALQASINSTTLQAEALLK